MKQKNITFLLTIFFLLLCNIAKATDVEVKLTSEMLASQEAFNAAVKGLIGETNDANLIFSLEGETTSLTDEQLSWIGQLVTDDENTAQVKSQVTGIDLSNIKSITTLPNGTFNWASSVREINLPNLKSLSANLFSNCSSLTSLTIGDWSNTIDNAGLEMAEIPAGCFQACGNLKNIKLIGVTSIGGWAFSGCTSMTTLPFTLKENTEVKIGNNAFENTGLIGGITLPEGIVEIGGDCFSSSQSLTSITLPSTVKLINASFVNGCPMLSSFIMPTDNDFYEVIDGILYQKNTTDQTLTLVRCPIAKTSPITIPADKNITVIADNAFQGCCMSEVFLNDGLTTIGASVFTYCDNLSSLTIPASVTQIASSFVNGCKSLATLTVEAGNTVYETVGNITYAHVTADGEEKKIIFRVPEAIVLPDGKLDLSSITGITEVGLNAFEDVVNMKELHLPDDIVTLADECFKSSGLERFYVPKHLSKATYGLAPFSLCNNLKEFVGEDLDDFSVSDGILYDKDYTKLYRIPSDKTTHDKTFTLPHQIKQIQSCAFEGVKNLTKVVFAQGTTEIPLRCFYNSKVEEVLIPNSVTTIGQDVFNNSSVTKVTMLSTTQVAPKTNSNNDGNYNSFYGINGGLQIHLSKDYNNFKDKWVKASTDYSTDKKDASRLFGWEGMENNHRLIEDVSHRAIFEYSPDITGFEQNVLNESDQTNTLSAEQHYDYITLYRDLSTLDDDTYATLALPVDVTKATLVGAFGANTQIWDFVGRKNSTLCFESVKLDEKNDNDIIIKKGVAVLFKPEYKDNSYLLQMNLAGESTEPNAITLNEETKTSFGEDYVKTVDTENNWNIVDDKRVDGVTFKYGFYATYQKSSNIGAGSYYMLSDGSFKYAKNNVKIKKAFRGFIHGNDNAINGDPEAKAMISFDGATTSIDDARIEGFAPQTGNIYSINGQLVRQNATSTEGLSKGIYIMNGKKVIIK